MLRLKREGSSRRPLARRPHVDALESRALLATAAGSFVAPDLRPYIAAFGGGGPTIQRMLTSLESQLKAGPLADLDAGTDSAATFSTAVNNYVVGYQASVNQQLPRFPTTSTILVQYGNKVSALIAADQAQLTVGFITQSTFNSQAAAAINSLTQGPLRPKNTPNSGFARATKTFETQLRALQPTLDTGANPALTLTQLQTVVDADSAGYVAAVNASLVGHNNVMTVVNNSVTALVRDVANIALTSPADASNLYANAITNLDNALLDTTGLFGPKGAHGG